MMDPLTVGALDDKSLTEQRAAHILSLIGDPEAPRSFEADMEASEISIREEDARSDLPVPAVIQMPSDDNSTTTKISDCTVSISSEDATADSQQWSHLTTRTDSVARPPAPHLLGASPGSASPAGETWAACDPAGSAAPQLNNNNASNGEANMERILHLVEQMINAAIMQTPSLSSASPPIRRASDHGYHMPQPPVYDHLLNPLPPPPVAWRDPFPYHFNHYHQRPGFPMSPYVPEDEDTTTSSWYPSLHHVRQTSSLLSVGYPSHHHPSSHVIPEPFVHDYRGAQSMANIGEHRYSRSENVPHRQHPEFPFPAHGNHQPLMTGNASSVPPLLQRAHTLDDRDATTTAGDLLRDQAQGRTQIGWAEQRRYPREPEFLEYERHHRVVDPPNADGRAAHDERPLPGLDEHRYRPEIQQPREPEGGGGGEEDTQELSIYSVLSHWRKSGRCGDPPEVRITKPKTVAPDPPVTPPSPPPSSYGQNRSDVVADSYDAGDSHLNVALVENYTAERIQSSRTYVKDALMSSNNDSVEKSSYMANTASTHGRTQGLVRCQGDSTIIKANPRAPDVEIVTTATIEGWNTPALKTPTEPRETAQADATPSEKLGPVSYPGNSNQVSNFHTFDECSTTATVEDSKVQGPISSTLPRMPRLYEDVAPLPVPQHMLPGAVSIPGFNTSFPRDSATNVRRVDVDSQLVSATLVDESEIETMNFLRELRADLDKVVQHLHKEPQEEDTKKRSSKKWFSPLRGLFQPRRRKATGVP